MTVWFDSMTLDFPSLSSEILLLIALATEPIIIEEKNIETMTKRKVVRR